MKIQAKLRYGYQMEVPVTIINIYDTGEEICAICIDNDGIIRAHNTESLIVTDKDFLPIKGD